MPRRCPSCRQTTIIGHGQRRKQAHDEQHDWIWVRRGLCRPCRKTFTILPSWSPPYGHYSFPCRQQAWKSRCDTGGSWEQCAPHTKDPSRLPDPATLRRWVFSKLLSLCCGMKASWPCSRACRNFFLAPTILAWDWIIATRLSLGFLKASTVCYRMNGSVLPQSF